MNIENKNEELISLFHKAGITGKNIIFDVLDSGVAAVDTLRPVNMTPSVEGDKSDHGTKVAWLLHNACPDAEIRSYYCACASHLITALMHISNKALQEPDRQHVVNISMVVNDKDEVDAELKRVIDALTKANIPVVCAAGNDGAEKYNRYPSCFVSPYTVSAIDDDGKKCNFTTWHDEVDFAEFGYQVLMKRADGATIRQSGTSFASPILAGKIGLLHCEAMEKGRRMTDTELYERLKAGCIELGAAGRDSYFGWGHVQVEPGAAMPKLPLPEENSESTEELLVRDDIKNVKTANTSMRKEFHDKGYKGKDIIFAVFDSGVNPVSRLKNKVTAAMPNADTDKNGHGTFVAGQLIEWCPDAEILSYNILGKGDCTPDEMNAAVASFLKTAKDDRSHQYIVNMSLSGRYDPNMEQIREFKKMLEELVDMNIPVVVAAGNDGEQVLNLFPSCFECPICVSSVNEKCKKSSFSTWHNEVDFAEHGEKVSGLGLSGGTTLKSGTSMACPNVAGKLGLLMSMYYTQNGTWMSEPEAYEKLKWLAHDFGNTGRDPYYGWGFVELELLDMKAEKPVEQPKEETKEEQKENPNDEPNIPEGKMNIVDTGLTWPNGKGNKRSKTDHIQIHHTVGNYGTPTKWASLHKSKQNDGQKGVPYSFLVLSDGTVYLGRGWEYSHGGVKDATTNNANQRSISISLNGNMLDDELPTKAQLAAAVELTKEAMKRYNLTAKDVLGHNEIPLYENGKKTGKLYATQCPGMDMDEFRKMLSDGVEGDTGDKTTGTTPTPTPDTTKPVQPPTEPETGNNEVLPCYVKYTGSSYVNVRQKASTDSKSLGKFKAKEVAIKISESNGWDEIVLYNQSPIVRGWCSNKWNKKV